MSSTLENPNAEAAPSGDWSALLSRAKEGCEESFEEIIEQVYNYLILTANTKINQDLRRKFGASDVVQSGILRAFGSIKRFEGSSEAEFRVWVRKIVLNSLQDKTRHYNTQKRGVDREHALVEEAIAEQTTPSHIALRNEEKMLLERYISRLPAIEQRVVEMRHRFGYSVRDIADFLNVSESRVRSSLQRAIGKLKTWFKDNANNHRNNR